MCCHLVSGATFPENHFSRSSWKYLQGAGDGCRLITVPPPYTLRPGICCSQSHTACQVTKLHQTELCSASQISWPPQNQLLSLPQCCLSAFLPSAWPLSLEEGMCRVRPGPSSLLSSSPCFCLSTQHLSNPSVGSCRHARLTGYSLSIWLSPKGKTLPILRGVRQQGRPHRVPAPSDSCTWLLEVRGPGGQEEWRAGISEGHAWKQCHMPESYICSGVLQVALSTSWGPF